MVDKITVYPESVRGLGDIVSPKAVKDYDEYNSSVRISGEYGSDVLFSMSYMTGSYLMITSAPRYIGPTVSSFNISARLYNSETGNTVSGGVIYCYVNDVLQETKVTDPNVSFTIPVDFTSTVYKVKLVFNGLDNTRSGCFAIRRVIVASDLGLDFTVIPSIIQVDETSNLLATIKGTGVDGGIIGVPGQTVKFYETYTPGLGVTSDKSIIQSGETCNVTAQLKDADDGSLIRQANVPIKLYTVFNGISPALDGSESVVSWSTMDNLTGDGIFRTHGGYLDEGWSNTGLWVLDFDYRYVTGNFGNAFKYVGLMPICSEEINPVTDEGLVNYAIRCWEGGFGFDGLGRSDWITSPESTPSVTQTDWNHIQITKLSNTRLQIDLNATYTWIGEFPNLANLETLYIGSRDNPSDRNKGGYVEYKEIVVEEI